MGQEINEVINSIDFIFSKGQKSGLTPKFFEQVSKESKVVSQYLGIESDIQSTLWSVVFSISISKNSSIDLDDFSSYFNTSVLRIFLYQKEFDELVKKKLLQKTKPSRRRRNNESLNYTNLFVPNDLIYSVISGEPLPSRRKSDLNIYEILDEVYSLFQQKDDCFIDTEELVSSILELISENKNLPFVRQILNYKLPSLEMVVLLFLCQQFTEGNSVDLVKLTRILLNDTQKQLNVRKKFINEDTKLQKCQLVSLETETNFKSDRTIILSPKGKDLFGEDKNLFIEQDTTKHSDIILSTSIVEHKLFFNEKEQVSLDSLIELLKPSGYNSIIQRLTEFKLKNNFSILFHGHPGTGKTESVYQISRLTGRDIKRVNISETKSKWFGESEKRIKSVFDSYRKLVESSELTPILLFNEVDGIFGSRKTNGTSSVDQTENSIQTIILQEMEDFRGIMICTTNLPMNLDKSFDRRFLYKICFNKPDSKTRFLIWKDKLPVLTEKQTTYLSETFNFSGGQIDNCCQKIFMKQILTGNTPNLVEIEQFCREETLETINQRNPIGFKIGSVSN
jgi:AAA+ superfamily predicted ATPase